MSHFCTTPALAGPRLNTLPRVRWYRQTAVLAVATATLLTALAVPATAEIWKDATGQFQVEAEFLGIRGQDLYLKKTNGVTIKVPLARLSAESQQLARQLAMPAAPAAPAVPAAPGAADTPVTAPMPGAADTPDAAARALAANLEAGNFRAVWEALPSRYQSDVNDLVHTFAANMDAGVWKAGTSLVLKAVRVLKEKKDFILKQPALAQSPVDPKIAAENWDGLVEVLETITSSELADLGKLKTLDVGAFLDGTGKKVADQMAALAKAADEKKLSLTDFPGVPVDAMPLAGIAKAKFSTVTIAGDAATLRVDNEGKTEDHEVVRVDGKWLPKEMVDQWQEKMQAAKDALTKDMPERLTKNKMQIMMPIQLVQGVLDQLLAAQTQQEFDQIVQQIMQTFAPQPPGAGPGVPPGGDAKPAADPFGP